MITAPRQLPVSTPRSVPTMLWRNLNPENTLEGYLDPIGRIAENPLQGRAMHDAPASVHLVSGIRTLTDTLSLTICCSGHARPAAEAVLVPFADDLHITLYYATTAKDISAALPDAANQPGLVFFEGLAEALASGLEAPNSETAIDALIAQWCSSSTMLLDQLRSSRGHITLIPAEALWSDPQAVQKAVAARYGLPMVPNSGVVPDASAAAPAPQFALMANTLALTDPKVRAILDQLNIESAASGGFDLGHGQTAQALRRRIDQALDERQHAAHDRNILRVEKLAEANMQRLRHQTDTARLRLLEAEAMATRLSEDAAQSTAAAGYLKEELTRREGIYAAQASELEMLRKSGHQTEQSRKASSLKSQHLETEVETLTRNIALRDGRLRGLAEALVGYEDEALALRDQVEPLREEVSALRRSTSWRLTAPLRGVQIMLRKVLRR